MEISVIKIFIERYKTHYDCDIKNFKVNVGDRIVVSSALGVQLAKVASELCSVTANNIDQLFTMERFATKTDIENQEKLKVREKEIIRLTKELVKKINLDMKITDAQIMLDNSKVYILFTAEERVDFRELVKELALNLKMRIELKQIGTRDEVKIMGGMGVCGRACCCSDYFDNFSHVSIKMAKVQNLSLNPTNISGICGRLLCCLAYENEYYQEVVSQMPKINSTVKTPDGDGVVIFNNLFKKTVDVRFSKEDSATEIKNYDLNLLNFEKINKEND